MELEILDYNNINELLEILGINIVKITTSVNNPYILYKNHKYKRYVVLSRGSRNSVSADLIHYFKQYDPNWYIKINPDGKNKTESKGKLLVRDFLDEDCDRVQYLINDPAKELVFFENNLKYFNLFQNTKYLVDKPDKEGDWSFIRDLIWNLCSEDEDKYNWVINWLKCLYQYPTYRFTTSIIFIGDKGSGKGLFSKVLKKIFDNCCYSANSKDLISSFNAHLLQNKVLLLANEIIDQNKKYQFSNDLKEFVTEDEISVEQKYSDRYMARSYIKLILFSNSRQPISIEEDDRRYFVCHSKSLKRLKTYEEINKFIEDEDYFISQVESFCAYLNNSTDYDFEKVVSGPPMTKEKESIIDINITDFKSIILEIMRDDLVSVKKRKNNDKIEMWVLFSNLYNFYCNEDYKFYNVKNITRKKFSGKLEIEGFNKQLLTIDNENGRYVQLPDSIVEYKLAIEKKNRKNKVDLNEY